MAVVAAALVGVTPAMHAAHAVSRLTLSVGDVSVPEGNSGSVTVQVPVDLSSTLARRAVVTATYTVSGGTATPGVDFAAKTGTLRFAGTNVSQTIAVTVLGDGFKEPDETINVTLSNVQGATDARDGTVTILDDDSDGAPEPTVSLGSVTVVEAQAGKHYAYVPVVLSDPETTPVVVNVFYACGTPQANAAFGATPTRTVTFSPGQQSATLVILIPAGTAPSAVTQFFEGLTVQVGNADVVTPDGSVTVLDDAGTAPPPTYPAERVSVAGNGSEGQVADSITCQLGYGSIASSVSPDGRDALFQSDAFNLVPNDNNDAGDLFLRDRTSGTTERIDVANDGSELSQGSESPYEFMSSDGNDITFATTSAELLPAGASIAVFVRDRSAGTTTLASVLPDGTAAPGASDASGLSPGGRYLAFENRGELYVRDLVARSTAAVAPVSMQAWPYTPMSSDGSQIAFISAASNLVAGDTNNYPDVFVRDLVSGSTERVNVTPSGAQETGPQIASNASRLAMSADGRYVEFWSSSANMLPGGTAQTPPKGSAIFVRDRVAGTTQLVSVGVPSSKPVCWANDGSMSADGRYVVFSEMCENKAGSVIDKNSLGVWVRDLVAGTTTRVDQTYTGKPPTAGGSDGMVSAGGNYVLFDSTATNLIPADTNSAGDVFIRKIN
ncbi:MAG TPA: Calx-beta domain-containing protein [Acidimicrobiia bacterium]